MKYKDKNGEQVESYSKSFRLPLPMIEELINQASESARSETDVIVSWWLKATEKQAEQKPRNESVKQNKSQQSLIDWIFS